MKEFPAFWGRSGGCLSSVAQCWAPDVTITLVLDFFELNITLFKSNKDTGH